MKISLNFHAFTRKVLHLATFWKWEFFKLRNDLLFSTLFPLNFLQLHPRSRTKRIQSQILFSNFKLVRCPTCLIEAGRRMRVPSGPFLVWSRTKCSSYSLQWRKCENTWSKSCMCGLVTSPCYPASRVPDTRWELRRELHVVISKLCANPSNPKIKIWILICCPHSFPTEVVGRSW